MRSLLIVGLSQSGKSTFCNSFVSEHGVSKIPKTFRTGGSHRSTTTENQIVTFNVDDESYKIIDTPGLGDEKVDDSVIYKKLLNVIRGGDEICHVVLIMNVGSGALNPQVKQRLQVYVSLIPNLGDLITLMIVDVTDKKIREKNDNPGGFEGYKRDVIKDLSTTLGFHIKYCLYQDSLPEDQKQWNTIRDNKLDILARVRKGTSVTLQSVLSKPQFMIDHLRSRIKRYEDEVKSLKLVLSQMNLLVPKEESINYRVDYVEPTILGEVQEVSTWIKYFSMCCLRIDGETFCGSGKILKTIKINKVSIKNTYPKLFINGEEKKELSGVIKMKEKREGVNLEAMRPVIENRINILLSEIDLFKSPTYKIIMFDHLMQN